MSLAYDWDGNVPKLPQHHRTLSRDPYSYLSPYYVHGVLRAPPIFRNFEVFRQVVPMTEAGAATQASQLQSEFAAVVHGP